MYVYVCTYVCMYVCIYIYMYVCIYIRVRLVPLFFEYPRGIFLGGAF